jgi:hypothetical protein
MVSVAMVLLLASTPVVDSFEMIWSTLRDHYWDAGMAGLDWQKVHDQYRPKVESAANLDEARMVMDEMIHKLPSSHLTLITPRAGAPVSATGKVVTFGNLPPMRVVAEHRKLASGAGYIRLNIFLDPVSVMPEYEQAIADFRSAPGIVLDLRGNPGGLGLMAMGIAGWFIGEEGKILGTMTGRNSQTRFEVNPRAEPYMGKLAILIDGGSGSTSEILAQGLKDLGRARLFGRRTMGEALPSQVVQLPDGDRFQYPEANYTSFKGRVLEGHGVEPDVSAEGEAALDEAVKWITGR